MNSKSCPLPLPKINQWQQGKQTSSLHSNKHIFYSFACQLRYQIVLLVRRTHCPQNLDKTDSLGSTVAFPRYSSSCFGCRLQELSASDLRALLQPPLCRVFCAAPSIRIPLRQDCRKAKSSGSLQDPAEGPR